MASITLLRNLTLVITCSVGSTFEPESTDGHLTAATTYQGSKSERDMVKTPKGPSYIHNKFSKGFSAHTVFPRPNPLSETHGACSSETLPVFSLYAVQAQ
jgi:hypothetical protein